MFGHKNTELFFLLSLSLCQCLRIFTFTRKTTTIYTSTSLVSYQTIFLSRVILCERSVLKMEWLCFSRKLISTKTNRIESNRIKVKLWKSLSFFFLKIVKTLTFLIRLILILVCVCFQAFDAFSYFG